MPGPELIRFGRVTPAAPAPADDDDLEPKAVAVRHRGGRFVRGNRSNPGGATNEARALRQLNRQMMLGGTPEIIESLRQLILFGKSEVARVSGEEPDDTVEDAEVEEVATFDLARDESV